MRERQRLSASLLRNQPDANQRKIPRDSYPDRGGGGGNYFHYENERTARKQSDHHDDDYENEYHQKSYKPKKKSREEKHRIEYEEQLLAEAEHVAHLEFLKERIDKRHKKLTGLDRLEVSNDFNEPKHHSRFPKDLRETEPRITYQDEVRDNTGQYCKRGLFQGQDEPLIDMKNRENRRVLQRQSEKLRGMRENYKRICSMSDGEDGVEHEQYYITNPDPHLNQGEGDNDDSQRGGQISIFQLNRHYKPTGQPDDESVSYSVDSYSDGQKNVSDKNESPRHSQCRHQQKLSRNRTKSDYFYDNNNDTDDCTECLDNNKAKRFKRLITKLRGMKENYEKTPKVPVRNLTEHYFDHNTNIKIYNNDRNKVYMKDSHQGRRKNYNDNYYSKNEIEDDDERMKNYSSSKSIDKLSKPHPRKLLMNNNEQFYSSAVTTNNDLSNKNILVDKPRFDNYKYNKQQVSINSNDNYDKKNKYVKRVSSSKEKGIGSRREYYDKKKKKGSRGQVDESDEEEEEFDRKNETDGETYIKCHQRRNSRVDQQQQRKKSQDIGEIRDGYRRCKEEELEEKNQDRKRKTAHTFCNCNQKGRVRCSRRQSREKQRKKSGENDSNHVIANREEESLYKSGTACTRKSRKGYYDTIKGELMLKDNDKEQYEASNSNNVRSSVNIVIEGPSETVTQESESEKSETDVTTDSVINKNNQSHSNTSDKSYSGKTQTDKLLSKSQSEKSPSNSKESNIEKENTCLSYHHENSDRKKNENSRFPTVSVFNLTNTQGVVKEINVNKGSAAIIKFVTPNSNEIFELNNESVGLSTSMQENQSKPSKSLENIPAALGSADEYVISEKDINNNNVSNDVNRSGHCERNKAQNGNQNVAKENQCVKPQTIALKSQQNDESTKTDLDDNRDKVDAGNPTNNLINYPTKATNPTQPTNHIIIVVSDQTPKIDGYKLVKDTHQGTISEEVKGNNEIRSTKAHNNDNLKKNENSPSDGEEFKRVYAGGRQTIQRIKPPLRGGAAMDTKDPNPNDSEDLYKSNNSSLLRRHSIMDKNRKEEKNKMNVKLLKWQLRQRNKVKQLEDNYNGLTNNNDAKEHHHYMQKTKNKKQLENNYKGNSNKHHNKEHHYVLDDNNVTYEEPWSENMNTNHDRKLQYIKDRYGRLRRYPIENEIINTSAIGRSSISISRFVVRQNDEESDHRQYPSPDSESSDSSEDDYEHHEVMTEGHQTKEPSDMYHIQELPATHRVKEPARSPYDVKNPTTTLDKIRLMKEKYKQLKYDKEV